MTGATHHRPGFPASGRHVFMASFAPSVVGIEDRRRIFTRGDLAVAFSTGLAGYVAFIFDLVVAVLVEIVVALIAEDNFGMGLMGKACRRPFVRRHAVVFEAFDIFLRQGKRNRKGNQDHR